MSRKRPLCAECGKPLSTNNGGVGVILHRFGGVPGAPEVGWHWELCSSVDSEMSTVFYFGPQRDSDNTTLRDRLRMIMDRGKGRVVVCSHKRFRKWLKGGGE